MYVCASIRIHIFITSTKTTHTTSPIPNPTTIIIASHTPLASPKPFAPPPTNGLIVAVAFPFPLPAGPATGPLNTLRIIPPKPVAAVAGPEGSGTVINGTVPVTAPTTRPESPNDTLVTEIVTAEPGRMVWVPITISLAEGMKVTVTPAIMTGVPVIAGAAENVIPPRTRGVVGTGVPGCWVGSAAVRVPT